VLVGYSFGSWCTVRYAVGDPGIAAVVAVGLPVLKYPFDAIAALRRPLAVVQPEHDEFGTPAQIRPVLEAADRPRACGILERATCCWLRPAGAKVAEAAWRRVRHLPLLFPRPDL
jgi:dienelactone hydrolase